MPDPAGWSPHIALLRAAPFSQNEPESCLIGCSPFLTHLDPPDPGSRSGQHPSSPMSLHILLLHPDCGLSSCKRVLPLLELEGPGGQAGGREFDFGLAHSDIQGEMLQSLWRRAFGCCGRAGSCDMEGVRGRERPVVPGDPGALPRG